MNILTVNFIRLLVVVTVVSELALILSELTLLYCDSAGRVTLTVSCEVTNSMVRWVRVSCNALLVNCVG